MKCPKCGRTLIEKHGDYGKFLACPAFPDCRYTHSSPTHCKKCLDTGWIEGKEDNEGKSCDCEWAKATPEISCSKCQDTGHLPFVKNGHAVPDAFIDCECHRPNTETNILHPEDFDFPMSYNFHRSLCSLHGWTDPGPCVNSEDDDVPPVQGVMKYRARERIGLLPVPTRELPPAQ